MISRLRLASAAFVLLMAGASAAFGQTPDSTAAAPHSGGMKLHVGGVGGQVGYSGMYTGGDYSKGAVNRFSFSGNFRYVASKHWGWQVDPYFTWAAYDVNTPSPLHDVSNPADIYKDHYLTILTGGNGQLLYFFKRGAWNYHLGAGPGVYRVLLENRRRIIKDPETFARHRGTYLGAAAEIGGERFFKNLTTTSLALTVGFNTAFAKDDAKFPNGFSDAPGVFDLRIGANYYFDLGGAGKKSGAAPAAGH
jgi:hypothetical protein